MTAVSISVVQQFAHFMFRGMQSDVFQLCCQLGIILPTISKGILADSKRKASLVEFEDMSIW